MSLAHGPSSPGKDEIGELAHSFNLMAGQITTLLSAERRLLQDVSHELRSPLARLGFAVELAKTSPDRETALGRIRQEADRLAHLVDELLAAHPRRGRPDRPNLEEVDLGELLRELVASCALEAEMQGCRLEPKIDATAIVTGDFELLQRACDNVLRNAIRHAPKGTSVAVRLSRPTTDRATISIRDHGPGVPADALHRDLQAFLPRRDRPRPVQRRRRPGSGHRQPGRRAAPGQDHRQECQPRALGGNRAADRGSSAIMQESGTLPILDRGGAAAVQFRNHARAHCR